jgi:hypothetical protein
MIRIGERPTAADGDEARVAIFGEDHSQHPLQGGAARTPPASRGLYPRETGSTALPRLSDLLINRQKVCRRRPERRWRPAESGRYTGRADPRGCGRMARTHRKSVA